MGVRAFLALSVGMLVVASGRGEAPDDSKKLTGAWELETEVIDGEKSDLTGYRSEWVFRGDRVTDFLNEKELFRTRYRIPEKTDPKAFDLLERDGKQIANKAIYVLDGETFKIAFYRESGSARPKNFEPEAGDDKVVRVYRRKK